MRSHSPTLRRRVIAMGESFSAGTIASELGLAKSTVVTMLANAKGKNRPRNKSGPQSSCSNAVIEFIRAQLTEDIDRQPKIINGNAFRHFEALHILYTVHCKTVQRMVAKLKKEMSQVQPTEEDDDASAITEEMVDEADGNNENETPVQSLTGRQTEKQLEERRQEELRWIMTPHLNRRLFQIRRCKGKGLGVVTKVAFKRFDKLMIYEGERISDDPKRIRRVKQRLDDGRLRSGVYPFFFKHGNNEETCIIGDRTSHDLSMFVNHAAKDSLSKS